jgi:hypothetical protein
LRKVFHFFFALLQNRRSRSERSMTGYRRPRSLLPTYAPVPPRKIARITNPRVPPTVSAIRHATRINPTNITASEILITSHTIPHPQPKPLAPIPGVKSGTDLIAYTEIHQHCHQPNGLTFEERMRIAQYPVKGGGFEIYRIPRPGTSELQLFLPLAVPTSRLGVPRLVLDTLYKSRPRHPCQASHAASSTETGSHAYARPMSFFDVATDRVTVREAQRARPPGC